jgi:hypothetical protein
MLFRYRRFVHDWHWARRAERGDGWDGMDNEVDTGPLSGALLAGAAGWQACRTTAQARSSIQCHPAGIPRAAGDLMMCNPEK